MKPDDPVCLCFHVTRRKVVSFIRVEKPRRPSQLSQCFGAGTGCGWCRKYLERMLEEELAKQAGSEAPNSPVFQELSYEQYAKQRSKYVKEGGGAPPPGAIPVDDAETP
ncbi:MAG: bacterioferritin-associated ferredoxin [Mariniblastus sp.]|jgi:bacterioferritin-associated ferredoxin